MLPCVAVLLVLLADPANTTPLSSYALEMASAGSGSLRSVFERGRPTRLVFPAASFMIHAFPQDTASFFGFSLVHSGLRRARITSSSRHGRISGQLSIEWLLKFPVPSQTLGIVDRISINMTGQSRGFQSINPEQIGSRQRDQTFGDRGKY